MVPITSGNVTTFSMIPIFDQYHVYKITDDDQSFIIAHSKKQKRHENVRIRFGGVLKELECEDEEHGVYLDASYYTPLS